MKKIYILSLLFPVATFSIERSKEALNKKLLEVIKQSSWENTKYSCGKYNENLKTIKSLLSAGADPNYCFKNPISGYHWPLLYYTIKCIIPCPDWQVAENPQYHRYDVVKLLLAHGANPDLWPNGMFNSTLFMSKTDLHLARLLLDYNANPNIAAMHTGWHSDTILKNFVGWTDEKTMPFVQLLLEYGADPLYPRHDKKCTNALDYARELRKDHLIPLFEKAGVQKLL